MLRIFHTADIQIEVRNSSPRYDEYLYMLNQLVEKANGYDIAVLDGDLTEYATPNEVERQLLVDFVSKLKTSVKEIVIIKGNHDLIQRQSQNTYIENGIKKYEIYSKTTHVPLEHIKDSDRSWRSYNVTVYSFFHFLSIYKLSHRA